MFKWFNVRQHENGYIDAAEKKVNWLKKVKESQLKHKA